MLFLKEKQQREEAERQRKELEDRLKRYEEEFEKAKHGNDNDVVIRMMKL